MKLPPGVQMAMQHLYEEGGHLLIDDKPGSYEEKKVIPGHEWRLFLTDNSKGTGDNIDRFAATQIQDTSTLDRFAMVIELDYLPVAEEVGMLQKKYPGMDKVIINRLVKFAHLVRNGYKAGELGVTLSPRGLQTACELMGQSMAPKAAVALAFINKIGDADEKKAVESMLQTAGLQ
jgi:cobaltochelatase CobS